MISWWWYPGDGILVMISWRWFPCDGILVMISWWWYPADDILLMISCWWYPADDFLLMLSWWWYVYALNSHKTVESEELSPHWCRIGRAGSSPLIRSFENNILSDTANKILSDIANTILSDTANKILNTFSFLSTSSLTARKKRTTSLNKDFSLRWAL